jgi:GT2 family glycosyltransferase
MISIIMPSLNPDIDKIKNTLNSIFENNGKYEVILVLQRANTQKINLLKQYFITEDRFKLVKDSGVGISRARNIGTKISLGEWILLLDDDIYIENNTIQELEKELDNNELFYYGNSMITGTKEHYVGFYITEKDIDIWSYNRICSISLIINKKVFDKIGYFDEKLGSGTYFGSSEESDLILRSLLNGINIKYLKKYIVYHEKAIHSMHKVEKYAMGAGALYKKNILSKNIKLYVKFLIDLIIRFLFLFTFKKKRYLFLRGFLKGFINYKKEIN